jgi:hypothetical protein
VKYDWKFEITNKDHAKEHGLITVQDLTPGQEGRTAQFYYGAKDLQDREIGDVLSSNMSPAREQDAEVFLKTMGWI